MIKMIAGTYGLPVKQPNGKTHVVGMGPNSGHFSIDPAREAELVAKHLAVYVNQPAPVVDEEQPEDTGAPIGFDEMPPEEGDADELPEGVTGIPEYNVEMKATQLREIGAMCGLTFPVGMKKADMVAALDKYIEEHTVEGVEIDANGEIAVYDEEPAPTFDASEAVL